MSIINIIDIHVMVLLLLSILLFTLLFRHEAASVKGRLFMLVIIVTIIGIIFEAVSLIIVGIPTSAGILLQHFTTTILYIALPVVPYFMLLYTHYNIHENINRMKKFALIAALPLSINTLLILSNPFTSLYFTVSSDGIFLRQSFFYVMAATAFFYAVILIIIIIKDRKSAGRNEISVLIYAILLAITGPIIDTLIFGASYTWLTITLGILIVYYYLEDIILNIDYLTKTSNRRQLEQYLSKKIANKTGDFCGYMLDIDDFKSINDTYGHSTGDKALIEMVEILKDVFGKKTFISRYAGDEFVIIQDYKNNDSIKIEKLNRKLEEVNLANKREYSLNASIGMSVYQSDSTMTAEEFIIILDKKMFKVKNAKKLSRRATDYNYNHDGV